MKVRNGDVEDITELTELLESCFSEMNYNLLGLTYSKKTMSEVLNNCIVFDMGAVIVAEEKNKIIGISVVFFNKSYMDASNTVAVEAIWHADPKINSFKRAKVMKALLQTMETRTAEKGIKHLRVGSSVLFPAMSKLLMRNGYQIQELSYTKEVS